MFIAYFAANNEYEQFETFEEAENWLKRIWDEASLEGFAEESIQGQDFIAKITHVSKFIETRNKEEDGFKWDEEACASINSEGEEWPVSEEFDVYGDMALEVSDE